jgi:hypothetical protein
MEIWKEAILVHSWHLPGQTVKNSKDSQSGQPAESRTEHFHNISLEPYRYASLLNLVLHESADREEQSGQLHASISLSYTESPPVDIDTAPLPVIETRFFCRPVPEFHVTWGRLG